jgi:PTS system glucitol/sorbitol-specific IIC component
MMNAIANAANWFIGLFAAAGTSWAGLITAIIPLLMVFLTFMYALTIFVGEERVEGWAEKLTKYAVLRYTLLPIMTCVLLTGFGAVVVGAKVVPDRYKGAYTDALMTFLHPSAGLFPHVHASEIFVYMGIATGITNLGLPLGSFAVRAFISVIPIMFIRGFISEKLFDGIYKRNQEKLASESKKRPNK